VAIRSLVIRTEIDQAKRAHDCQASKRHRIKQGDIRLAVHISGQSPDHYCADCARKIIERDLEKLQQLAARFPRVSSPADEETS
jgi:hypothetical protein